MDHVILVDTNDHETGTMEKMEAHRSKILAQRAGNKDPAGKKKSGRRQNDNRTGA